LGFSGGKVKIDDTQSIPHSPLPSKSDIKKCKIVKSRGGGMSLIVGEDMRVAQIAEMDGFALVCKFCRMRVFISAMGSWLEEIWNSVLGYIPTFHMLLRGWIGILFRENADVTKILVGN
jgi:hypothetical protein